MPVRCPHCGGEMDVTPPQRSVAAGAVEMCKVVRCGTCKRYFIVCADRSIRR